MVLYYIRHGDPVYDPDSLTEEGHRQAQALAERFKLHPFDEIYCSTSVRAQMTAEPTCNALRKKMILLDWAHEANAGKYFFAKRTDGRETWAFYEPRTRRAFNAPDVRALGNDWTSSPRFRDTRYAEGVAFINKSTDGFMRTLGYEHDRENGYYTTGLPEDNRRIALFAHQGIGFAFLSSLLDIPYPYFSTHYDIGHTGVTVIEFRRRDDDVIFPCVLQHSNDSHLFAAGLSTTYNGREDL